MSERVLPLLAVALTAIGCSVLVNTDYAGGTEPSASNKGGQGGDMVAEVGGSLPAVGGTLGEGGMSEAGTGDVAADGGAGNPVGGQGGSSGLGGTGGAGGDAGDPEGGSGAEGGTAGSSGGLGGSAGMDATGGAGAGVGGALGGAGMGGSAGMTAGMSGAGGMTCNADLMTDPAHCGSCDKACADGVNCESGICITSPCVGICTTPTPITKKTDGYREDNIPATEACFETTMYSVSAPSLPSFICWNIKDRMVQVNGVTLANGTNIQCQADPGAAVPATRAGGYCVHVTASKAGDTTDGFKFPTPGELMPSSSSTR